MQQSKGPACSDILYRMWVMLCLHVNGPPLLISINSSITGRDIPSHSSFMILMPTFLMFPSEALAAGWSWCFLCACQITAASLESENRTIFRWLIRIYLTWRLWRKQYVQRTKLSNQKNGGNVNQMINCLCVFVDCINNKNIWREKKWVGFIFFS